MLFGSPKLRSSQVKFTFGVFKFVCFCFALKNKKEEKASYSMHACNPCSRQGRSPAKKKDEPQIQGEASSQSDRQRITLEAI